MVALNSRVARLEKQQTDVRTAGRPPSSPLAEWFQRLHQQINQVDDWDNPPIDCMAMKDSRCYRWVITVPLWSYWVRILNETNGREILQTEYNSPEEAAAAFQLGAELVNQAYNKVMTEAGVN